MHHRRVYNQPAYVLHNRPYRDSSVVLELFTAEYGRETVIAKGAKNPRSKLRGALQLFQPLSVSWTARTELGTLTDAQGQNRVLRHSPSQLAGLFYMNELLIRLLPRFDPHIELFSSYDALLSLFAQLQGERAQAQMAMGLRVFEIQLLATLGYGLQLESELNGAAIEAQAAYRYVIPEGPQRVSNERQSGVVPGQVLLLLGAWLKAWQNTHTLTDCADVPPHLLAQARRLMAGIIEHRLDGKPLSSRMLLTPSHRKESLSGEEQV